MQAFSLQLTWSLNLLHFDMCINCLYFPGLEKWISLLQRSLATSRAESWPFSFSTPAGKHTHSALTLCQLHSRLERGNFRNSEEVGRCLGWTRENAANPYHVKLEVVVFVVVWSGKTRFSNLDVCDWRGKLEWLLVCTLYLSLSLPLYLSLSISLSLSLSVWPCSHCFPHYSVFYVPVPRCEWNRTLNGRVRRTTLSHLLSWAYRL